MTQIKNNDRMRAALSQSILVCKILYELLATGQLCEYAISIMLGKTNVYADNYSSTTSEMKSHRYVSTFNSLFGWSSTSEVIPFNHSLSYPSTFNPSANQHFTHFLDSFNIRHSPVRHLSLQL